MELRLLTRPDLIPPEATAEMRQWEPRGWPFDKLRTGFSLDARVRIEARDRKRFESQGEGAALLGASRTQRLA